MLSVKLIKGLWFKQEKELKMGKKRLILFILSQRLLKVKYAHNLRLLYQSCWQWWLSRALMWDINWIYLPWICCDLHSQLCFDSQIRWLELGHPCAWETWLRVYLCWYAVSASYNKHSCAFHKSSCWEELNLKCNQSTAEVSPCCFHVSAY